MSDRQGTAFVAFPATQLSLQKVLRSHVLAVSLTVPCILLTLAGHLWMHIQGCFWGCPES